MRRLGREEPAEQQRGRGRAQQLGDDEGRRVDRADAGEGVGQAARDGDRGIGEGRGGGEPIAG
jgi:hypothetical protein